MNGWKSSTGNLNRRVSFLSQTPVISATGSVDYSSSVYLSTWADVRELRGKEILAQGKETAVAEATFLIRYRTDKQITKDLVIDYNGKRWEILSVTEIGYKERIEIHAMVRNDL